MLAPLPNYWGGLAPPPPPGPPLPTPMCLPIKTGLGVSSNTIQVKLLTFIGDFYLLWTITHCHYLEHENGYCCCCIVVLRPRKTSKAMSGWPDNLTTLFRGRLGPPKRLTSTSCTYFRQLLTTAPFESAEGETKVCGQTSIEPRTSDL